TSITYLDESTERMKMLVKEIPEKNEFGKGVDVIGSMLATTYDINNNSLIRTLEEGGYYFCPKVKYDAESLETLRDKLVDLRNAHSLLSDAEATAGFISSETKRRVELRKNMAMCMQYASHTEQKISDIKKGEHPTVNYTEVKDSVFRMETLMSEILWLCESRDFVNAAGAMNRFNVEEERTVILLSNISAEYDTVRMLYTDVLDELLLLPPETNSSEIFESMNMINRELGIVHNVSDLVILKNVLLENRENIKLVPTQGIDIWVGTVLPAIVAILLTAAIYIIIKKNKRVGL
ncbi:MAG: hypothetical protein ABIG39_00180, partial [Candidatus Micrarchaeota archaeon]